jgi:hypothetical protein
VGMCEASGMNPRFSAVQQYGELCAAFHLH